MPEKDYDLYIFDVDGTLTTTRSAQRIRRTADDWTWLPGRVSRLIGLRARGKALAIATNQGGVALGDYPKAEMQREIDRVAAVTSPPVRVFIAFGLRNGTVPELRFDDPMRKPRPGMLLAAMAEAGVPPRRTLMVGDREPDRLAAIAAGCDFAWADDFFPQLQASASTLG